MKCGYCGKEHGDAEPHICIEGRDFIVAENTRLRAANAELRKILARALAEEKCGADGVFFTVATECTEGRCWHFQARAALSRAEQAKPEPETCVWSFQSTPTDDKGWYTSTCGGSSVDVGKYCLYCGKKVKVNK